MTMTWDRTQRPRAPGTELPWRRPKYSSQPQPTPHQAPHSGAGRLAVPQRKLRPRPRLSRSMPARQPAQTLGDMNTRLEQILKRYS